MEIRIVVRWYLYIETVHRLQRRKHSNWPNSQSPQCTSLIFHNAPYCNRNMHISVAKWCVVGYLSNALWADLWDWSITVTYLSNCHKRHGQPRHRYHISLAVWSAFYYLSIFHNTISGEIKHQPLIYMYGVSFLTQSSLQKGVSITNKDC